MMAAPQGYAVEIDDGLIPAVRLLWDNGIPTTFSCQGDPASADEPEGFTGYVALGAATDMPRALELLRSRPELHDVRSRRLTEFERDRRDRLRRGEPVYGPLRFEIPDVPGESAAQWRARARVAARAAEPVLLTQAECAEWLRWYDTIETAPGCIDFGPIE